jgi:hypothetical protein
MIATHGVHRDLEQGRYAHANGGVCDLG